MKCCGMIVDPIPNARMKFQNRDRGFRDLFINDLLGQVIRYRPLQIPFCIWCGWWWQQKCSLLMSMSGDLFPRWRDSVATWSTEQRSGAGRSVTPSGRQTLSSPADSCTELTGYYRALVLNEYRNTSPNISAHQRANTRGADGESSMTKKKEARCFHLCHRLTEQSNHWAIIAVWTTPGINFLGA